jgi:hypothetical protein
MFCCPKLKYQDLNENVDGDENLTGLLGLSEDVLYEVLRYLDYKELGTVGKVCRRLFQISNEEVRYLHDLFPALVDIFVS